MIRIFWKEEVWGEVRSDNCEEKGEVVEGISAIVGLPDPLIGIIDVGCTSERRGWEVIRKRSLMQTSMKVNERSRSEKPF